MDINLVLTAGLAYTFLGALVLMTSHRALYQKANRIVAGYPKVLAALHAQRADGRFGLILIVCGSVLQLLAACGYTVSPAYWPYPAFVAAAVLCAYGVNRLLSMRRLAALQPKLAAVRGPILQFHETRRSRVLMDAARNEAVKYQAREIAREPRDSGVVYVAREWECRWWCDKLGVSPEALKAAVRQVGPMLHDVERHFERAPRARRAIAA